jgi:3',5'-nucleoside bisphosphate phosphatase
MNLSTTGLGLTSDSVINLHLHTTFSDGSWKLDSLFDYLLTGQFSLVAITDHDRPDTVTVIQQQALEKHLPVLVGVEMSSFWKGDLVDLLCYGFNSDQNPLTILAEDVIRRQQENSREVFENLQRQGYTLPPDILSDTLTQHNLQQPFALADALCEHGYGSGDPSVGKILLAAGCKMETNEPGVIVDAAHRCGAVCFLAHPGRGDGFVTFDVPLMDEFRREAPVDGLEVHYPLHTPDQTAMYLEYAQNHHLLVSAGSDSHGPEKPPIKYQAELCHDLLERLGIRME